MAEIELQRQAVLLKWIDEQLPIIASKCQTSDIRSGTQGDHQLTSKNLVKRKRAMEESAHVKDSRSKVKFVDIHDSTVSLTVNTNDRDSRLAGLPQRKAARRSYTNKQQRSKSMHQEAHAVLIPAYASGVFELSQKRCLNRHHCSIRLVHPEFLNLEQETAKLELEGLYERHPKAPIAVVIKHRQHGMSAAKRFQHMARALCQALERSTLSLLNQFGGFRRSQRISQRPIVHYRK